MAICPYAVHDVFVAWEEPTDDLFYKEAASLSVLLCFVSVCFFAQGESSMYFIFFLDNKIDLFRYTVLWILTHIIDLCNHQLSQFI